MTSHDQSAGGANPPTGGAAPGLHLELLGRMEEGLTQLLQTARAIREALRHADQEGLRLAQGRQESLLRGMLALRDELAVLATSGPQPGGVELDRRKQRVRALVQEVDALNRRNAALTRCCLGFVQHCLYDLAGGGAAVMRYGPTGATLEVRRGTFLEARG